MEHSSMYTGEYLPYHLLLSGSVHGTSDLWMGFRDNDEPASTSIQPAATHNKVAWSRHSIWCAYRARLLHTSECIQAFRSERAMALAVDSSDKQISICTEYPYYDQRVQNIIYSAPIAIRRRLRDVVVPRVSRSPLGLAKYLEYVSLEVQILRQGQSPCHYRTLL